MATSDTKTTAFLRWLRGNFAKLFDSETYSKGFLFKVALCLLALVFWNQLVSFYQEILVEPVLSKVTSDGLRNLGFGLVAGLLSLLIIAQIRRAYRPGLVQLVSFVLPGLLYLLTRDGEQWGCRWHFASFQGLRWLYYADVLVLPLVGAVVLPLVAYWRMQRPIPASVTKSYFQDDASMPPNPNQGRDARDPEAQRLMEQLNALRPLTAFAVGIVGQWGSGKTQFLQLMQQHLPVDAILIQFNPWLVESTAAIRKEFFTTLKDSLGKYSGELATELTTYANGLAEVVDSTAAKAFKEAISFLSDQPNLTEQFDKVNQVIGQLKRPIFIFIDDIDRLDKDEVLETLRIVRNTANFRNTVFVLAYDRAYVLEAVQRTNQANSGQYLDKIVQFEFSLPNFSASALAERTLEVVLAHVAQNYHAELTDLISRRANQRPARNLREQLSGIMQEDNNRVSYYPELITTMRGAVRFASLFIHDFLPLAGEVRLDEFVNLTLLKLRFPSLYEAIRTQRVVESDLTKTFSAGGTVMTLNSEKLNDFFLASTLPRHEQQLATSVVEHLFEKEQLTSSERTIQRPSSFDLYFLAGNFTNVSLTAIEQLRRGSSTAIRNYVDKWQQTDHLLEALEVLTNIRVFNDRQDFENVVAAGLEIGKRLERGMAHWLLVLNAQYDDLIERFYGGQESEMATWFKQLLAAAPEPQIFEANLIKDLQLEYRSRGLSKFWITKEELCDLALDYLVRHLTTHPQVDHNAFKLHWGTVYDVDNQGKVLTDERANLMIRDSLQANPLGALPSLLVLLKEHSNAPTFVFQPLLPRIFGSWQNVQRFLQQIPPSPETSRIQKDFTLFKEGGYREFTR